jgi:transcriptional regulator with XRE-family HTH domain
MADRLRITRSAYHNIESGESYSWAKYLNEIFAVFETSPKEFFSDIGNRVVNQNNYESSQGYIVEHLHQENREVWEKLLVAKDEQIALLKSLYGK